MAPDIAQARLWKTPSTRKILSQSISNRDLATCRLVCRKLAVLLAPLLFADITIHFCSSTLPGPSRMAFLERIGRHIEAMAFKIPHSAVTFLPPILDPVTVAPQTFIYRPRHPDAYHSSPKYGSQEMTGWLVKHPGAHEEPAASSNQLRRPNAQPSIPPECRGLCLDLIADGNGTGTINIIDDAFAALDSSRSGALFAAEPGIWRIARFAETLVADPPFDYPHDELSLRGGPTDRADHLKLLHAYLQSFPALKNRTPSPNLDQNDRSAHKFPKLEHLELVNATMDATQVASFIFEHRHSLQELNLEDVVLRSGTWDEALAPLTRLSGSE
ncbi:hypothetical protein NUU61_008316 [Penicillium alfredii]|uniref:F-box domain-containing protein n=1 Tax=Penicillium alfredii TaxID=1506179 RepID=A0A9W9ESF0_9EURO|nr:uncharacterized protein NUU61_008316 [Penicillium alfredii]KAJ5087009.1 hypothetical protein NUU61_008316 [Penicillium alfredii]